MFEVQTAWFPAKYRRPHIGNNMDFALLGTIQITGEELTDIEVNDICNSLKNGAVRLLSLRGCHLDNVQFKRITDTLKENSSLVQLNLSLGVVGSKQRVKWLSEALKCNKNLSSLL